MEQKRLKKTLAILGKKLYKEQLQFKLLYPHQYAMMIYL